MKGRYHIFLACGAGLGLALVAQRVHKFMEPTYQGRNPGQWFKEFCAYPHTLQGATVSVSPSLSHGRSLMTAAGQNLDDPPLVALRTFGPHAVPYLIKALKTMEPTPLEEWLLGGIYDKLWRQFSPGVRQQIPKPFKSRLSYERPSQIRENAAFALAGIGGLEAAESELIAALHEESRWPFGHQSVFFTFTLAFLKRSKTAAAEIDRLVDKLTVERRYPSVVAIIEKLELKNTNAVVALGSLLESNDLLLRPQALRLLEPMRGAAKPLLPALTRALGDSDRDVRYWSLRVLGALGPDARAAESHIAGMLKDSDPFVREYSAYLLSLFREKSVLAKPVPLEEIQRQEVAERLGFPKRKESSSLTLSVKNELSLKHPGSNGVTPSGFFQTLSLTNSRAKERPPNER